MTIISHSRQFIFLGVPKTASVSIEMYLSLYCNPQQGDRRDLVSNPHPDAGFFDNSNNFPTECQHLTIKHLMGFPDPPYQPDFLNHRFPGQSIWQNYFKFATIRNPWDWFLSGHYHTLHINLTKIHATPYMKIKQYLYNFVPMKIKLDNAITYYENHKRYAYDGMYVMQNYIYDQRLGLGVDKVMRYETLKEDLSEVCKKLDIPWTGRLEANGKEIRKHGDIRNDYRHYRDVYTPEQAERIGKLFKEFNNEFGYEY